MTPPPPPRAHTQPTNLRVCFGVWHTALSLWAVLFISAHFDADDGHVHSYLEMAPEGGGASYLEMGPGGEGGGASYLEMSPGGDDGGGGTLSLTPCPYDPIKGGGTLSLTPCPYDPIKGGGTLSLRTTLSTYALHCACTTDDPCALHYT